MGYLHTDDDARRIILLHQTDDVGYPFLSDDEIITGTIAEILRSHALSVNLSQVRVYIAQHPLGEGGVARIWLEDTADVPPLVGHAFHPQEMKGQVGEWLTKHIQSLAVHIKTSHKTLT